jgi:hypothetical protein
MKLNELFYEILEIIFEYLNDCDKLNLRLVNRRFSKIRYKIKMLHEYNEKAIKIFSFENLKFDKVNYKINIQYLESLKICSLDNYNPFDVYPDSLIEIYFFSIESNQHKIKSLPSQLKIFSASLRFNESIDDLPDSVEYIWLSYRFSQKINKYPKSLKRLRVCYKYPYISDIPSHIEITHHI